MYMTLDQLPVNESGKIIGFVGPPEIRHKLMEMGLIKNKVVEMIDNTRKSPLIVRQGSSTVALRDYEANTIEIEHEDKKRVNI